MVTEPVLIIESEQPLLRLIAWALADAGYDALIARSIHDALTLAAAHRPSAVIFNTGMPDREKAIWIAEVRDAAPNTRVIDLVTAERQPHGTTGADAYLETPLYPDKVIDAVRSVMSAA